MLWHFHKCTKSFDQEGGELWLLGAVVRAGQGINCPHGGSGPDLHQGVGCKAPARNPLSFSDVCPFSEQQAVHHPWA